MVLLSRFIEKKPDRKPLLLQTKVVEKTQEHENGLEFSRNVFFGVV